MFQIKYNGGINLVNEGLVLKNCMFEILVCNICLLDVLLLIKIVIIVREKLY